MFEAEGPPSKPGPWRRLPRGAKVLVVLGVVVALVAGVGWYQYPANRIRRALKAIETPAGLRLAETDISDNGWICFDSCSYGSRHYLRSVSARAAVDALVAAVRAEGYEVDAVQPCQDPCTYANSQPHLLASYEFQALFRGKGMYGSVTAGVRVDGQQGAELSLGP